MAFGSFYSGFTVWRAARISDGQGGWTETYQDTGQTVSGALSPLGGGEQIRADQERGVVSHRFSCPSSVTIYVKDQVRYSGRVLHVDAVRRTSRGRRIECVCEETTGGASAS